MIRGAQAIAKTIGEHRGAIPALVRLEALSAWQKKGEALGEICPRTWPNGCADSA